MVHLMKKTSLQMLGGALGALAVWFAAGHFATASYTNPSFITTIATYATIAATTCNSSNSGQLAIVTDSPINTARCSGSAWIYSYGGFQITPPSSLSWSWDNQDASVVTSGSGIEHILSDTASTDSLHVRYTATPAAPYTIDMLIRKDWLSFAGDERTGVVFRESSSGKLIVFYFGHTASGALYFMAIDKFTNSTTFSATYDGGTSVNYELVNFSQEVWLRIKNDDTNLSWYSSFDGVNFRQFGSSRAKANFFTTAPDGYGFTVGHATGTNVPAVSLIAIKIS